MHITTISSAANPRLKLAKSLQTKRARRKQQQILLEGERLIADSMSAGFAPALFFFTPQAEQRHPLLLARAAQSGAQLLRVEPALFAGISDTRNPQGLLAISPIPQIPSNAFGITLVLDGVRDPGNLGTLLRTAAAANVAQILLLPGVTDPWAPKVMRSGMGAHFRISLTHIHDAAELRARLPRHQLYFADARGPQHYTDIDWTQPSALILGGETEQARLINHCPSLQPIAIPMARGVESLNVAVAGSIILFEAARQQTNR